MQYWYINEFGTPIKADFVGRETLYDKCRKNFGNYFETEEKANKAAKRLKAFAILRKRGLKFNGWTEADRGMVGEFTVYCDALDLEDIEQELEIAFGVENDA